MRILVFVLCGMVFTKSGLGQSLTCQDNSRLNDHFAAFISSLKVKKTADQKTVKHLFNKAHKDFLKTYRAYSQLIDIFEKGNYDCLSGTYFLTQALDELGFSYKIFETNYHIFLTVQTRQGDVLLESTDPANGFVSNRKLIKEKIKQYQQSKINSDASQLYLSRLRMFHELLPAQLPGLLYFNRAVEAFNKNELDNCCKFLEQAWKIYDNPRIEVFTPILIHSIESSALATSEKEKLTTLLKTHQQSAAHSIASR